MSYIEDRIAAASFPPARKGYDPGAVDQFLAALAEDVTRLEEAARADGVRIRTLERELSALQVRDADPATVFLEIAEAKERMLAEARREADRIVSDALAATRAARAVRDTGTDGVEDAAQEAVSKALEEARAIEEAARQYADTIVEEARTTARALVQSASVGSETLQH